MAEEKSTKEQLEIAKDHLEDDVAHQMELIEEGIPSCGCIDFYWTMRVSTSCLALGSIVAAAIAIYIFINQPFESDDEFTTDIYIPYIIAGAAYLLTIVFCCLPRPKIPRSYRKGKIQECALKLNIPGKDEESEQQIFKNLWSIGESYVTKPVYGGVSCKPPYAVTDLLPERVYEEMFCDEAKEEMTGELRGDLEGIFFPFELPEDSDELMDLVYKSIIEQFECIIRGIECPSVFTKSFKEKMIAKVNGLLDVPFVSMENQTELMDTMLSVIDVLLPRELRGAFNADILKGIARGIPAPKRILNTFRDAKDDVVGTIAGLVDSDSLPKELVERLIGRVWDLLDGMIACDDSTNAFSPAAKQAIVERMNRGINIPFLSEESEEVLIYAFFSAMEIAMPAEALKLLSRGRLDRNTLDEVFADDFKEESIELLASINIPFVNDSHQMTIATTMFEIFETAVREALDSLNMLDDIFTALVDKDFDTFLGDAEEKFSVNDVEEKLRNWLHSKTDVMVAAIIKRAKAEAKAQVKKAEELAKENGEALVSFGSHKSLTVTKYREITVRGALDVILGLFDSGDVVPPSPLDDDATMETDSEPASSAESES